MCSSPTQAQQMGLAGSCQEGAGSSAAELRFPLAACMTCGPSRRRQSALPLYAPTDQSGHRPVCMWALLWRAELIYLFLRIYLRWLCWDLGCLDHLSCLQLCRLSSLWVRVVGGSREPSYPSGVRGESTILGLAGDGESAPTGFDGTNQQHCLYRGCGCPMAALWMALEGCDESLPSS